MNRVQSAGTWHTLGQTGTMASMGGLGGRKAILKTRVRQALLVLAAAVGIAEPLYSHTRVTAPGMVCAVGDCDFWFALDLWIPYVVVPVLLGLAWATDHPPPTWYKVLGTSLSAGLAWVVQLPLQLDMKIPEAGQGTTLAGGFAILVLFVPLAYLLIGIASRCGSAVLRVATRSTVSKNGDTETDEPS